MQLSNQETKEITTPLHRPIKVEPDLKKVKRAEVGCKNPHPCLSPQANSKKIISK
jgi:hypothetical protein